MSQLTDYNEIFRSILKDGARSLADLNYWDGKIANPVDSHKSITICTTCMNRLDDLKQTLLKNIEDNIDYKGDFEFLVLDYNSSNSEEIEAYARSELQEYIDKGILSFYRTDEPKHYSMAHSRNVCFRLAKCDIVNSVDADNFINKGFLDRINLLAHQQKEKAAFVKGRRMLRGRLGFYKKEFVDLLGGYDEELGGYGHEDHDLLYRAAALGFKLMWFGGEFYSGLDNSKKHQVANFENKDWRYTEKRNKLISFFNIYYKMHKANSHKTWGSATVTKNFDKSEKFNSC